jgi:hypothetical protein
MRDFPQKLEAVVLGLHRILFGVGNPPDHSQLRGSNFDLLPLTLRRHYDTYDVDTAAGGDLENLAHVVGELAGRYDLDRVKARPVRDVNE